MSWVRTSSTGVVPADPVGEAVAAAAAEVFVGADVELRYAHAPADDIEGDGALACAYDDDPPGWVTTLTVRLSDRMAPFVRASSDTLRDILEALPTAALRTARRFRPVHCRDESPVSAAVRRALRDTMAVELLTEITRVRSRYNVPSDLVADTIDYLIELSGSRVESQDLTHGVIVTDVLRDEPRLQFAYPDDVRSAKRAPLLFDGRQSVLVVDPRGRARTELQRNRLDRFAPPDPSEVDVGEEYVGSGSLVAEATRRLGGLGFFLRADRTIWTFVDGHPILVRRSGHWAAYPVELTATVSRMIGGGDVAARLVVQAAFMISAQRHGAILAIVDDGDVLDGAVALKDRYDLRNEIDPQAMRTETRLHHLIQADQLDASNLARLAVLDGATILDRDGRLLAYGAIVTSKGSEYEGARTVAAKTLSNIARVVLKVSADGDITVFRGGMEITNLLAQPYAVGS